VEKTGMKKAVEWGFLVVLMLCVGVFLYMYATFKLDIRQRQAPEGYEEVTEYRREAVADDACPVGEKSVYTFEAGQVEGQDVCLVFFSLHQTVSVRVDGEEIYSIKPDGGNAFGKTTGCVWNTVMLSEKDSGKQVTVELVPVYKSAVNFVPDFLLGSRYAIYRSRIMAGLMSIICGFLSILIGGFYILYILYNRRNTEIDQSLLMLGIFSVLLGCWKIVDTNAFYLIFPGRVAFSYSDHLLLALVTVPYCMFMRQMHSSAEKRIWYLPCLASIAVTFLVLVLQVSGTADTRQMLRLIHFQLLFMGAVCVVMVVREMRTAGLNARLKKNLFCIFLCFAGLAVDLSIYYITHGKFQSFLGIINFLIYNLVLGISTMREAKELMAIGMQAKRFENMAYHDQMTGMYNRRAYADFIGDSGFDPEGFIVVACDLNELKKCNDTLGHEMGDKYIKESARIISECFKDSGRCYRMGGDEFCVLLKNLTLEECGKRIGRLKEMAAVFTRENSEIKMEIACGYELFDRHLDFDISDTSRRADKMMYEEKFSMKQRAGAA